MPRKTKVVGFSLPPEINNQIEDLLQTQHKTRSEFFRELIQMYFSASRVMSNTELEKLDLNSNDLAKILQSYWLAKSQSGSQIVVTGLAIIRNESNQVLIGLRNEKDRLVPNLSWSFVGGKFESLEFGVELQRIAKQRTTLEIKVQNLITARVLPDSNLNSAQVVALYFDCLADCDAAVPMGTYSELRWVQPMDVFKYFTSSTSDEVTRFLVSL